jgi:hypothetical protein
MSQVCAVDAESPRAFLSQEVALQHLTAAVIALRVASAYELENKDLFVGHEEILAARNESGNRQRRRRLVSMRSPRSAIHRLNRSTH